MNFISIVTSLLIILGAIVMAVNLLRFRAIPHMLNQLSVEEYGKLKLLIDLHQILMGFFLLGYMAVFYGAITKRAFVDELFVGIIFFFGAIFVFLGILIHYRMIASIKNSYLQTKSVSASLELEQVGLTEVNRVLMREIEERKHAEEALQKSKEKYHDLFKNNSDLLFSHDLDGNFTETNLAWKSTYGYTEEDLVNMNIRDLIPERYKNEFRDYLKRIIRNGKGSGLMRVVTKDGSERIIEYRNSVVHDSTGAIEVQGSGRDITESIQAKKALKKSEEKYRTILENIEDGYYEVDIAGHFTFFNDSMHKILGYTRDELMGMNNREYMDKENAKKAYKTFNKIYTTGKPDKGFDWEITRKDGKKRYVETSLSLIKNPEGQRIGFRGILRDVTERNQMEALLIKAQKMEAIGSLAGGVAHDLNNVLSGLVSYPDLLLMDIPQESPLREPILTIQKSGEKAATIVQDLLTLARRGVAVDEVANIGIIVGEYLMSPEYKKLKSYHPKVEVETDFETKLLNILGSSVHLSKTVMNLVSNASEAMPDGGKISISTKNRYIDRPIRGYDNIEEGDYVVLKVQDNGTGIPPEDLDKIFEPFYTKKVMGRSGTGLGMAVVWGTVKDHKGYIDVQSTRGEGTTFTLYFPVTRKEEATKDKSKLPIEDYMGNGESILVVDDVEDQRVLTCSMLQKLGYSVSSVSSGEEAVDYMKNNSADLLVLDMIMDPGIDGFETYKRILKLHPGQKAVITSGFSETDRIKEAQSLGAGPYVKKPYSLEKIGMALRTELVK